jgi:hypothetical protein
MNLRESRKKIQRGIEFIANEYPPSVAQPELELIGKTLSKLISGMCKVHEIRTEVFTDGKITRGDDEVTDTREVQFVAALVALGWVPPDLEHQYEDFVVQSNRDVYELTALLGCINSSTYRGRRPKSLQIVNVYMDTASCVVMIKACPEGRPSWQHLWDEVTRTWHMLSPDLLKEVDFNKELGNGSV